MSNTVKKIGVALISFEENPRNRKKFEINLVILKEWFNSTVSEPVKLVAIKPLNRSGYIRNKIILNERGAPIPTNLIRLTGIFSLILFFSY